MFNACGRSFVNRHEDWNYRLPSTMRNETQTLVCGMSYVRSMFVFCVPCKERIFHEYPHGYSQYPGDRCQVHAGVVTGLSPEDKLELGRRVVALASENHVLHGFNRDYLLPYTPCETCEHAIGWAELTDEERMDAVCPDCQCAPIVNRFGDTIRCGDDCICAGGVCDHCSHGSRSCDACSDCDYNCVCDEERCGVCGCGVDRCEECHNRCCGDDGEGCTCLGDDGCRSCGVNVPYVDSGRDSSDSPLVRSYSARAEERLQFLGNPPDRVWFGVELETNVRPSFSYNGLARKTLTLLGEDFVILKHDGSIGRGFEIVTAPATLLVHRERWTPFFASKTETEDLKGLDSWDSGLCGMHVHVSKPPAWHIAKMRQFLNVREHHAEIVKLAGRGDNTYCGYKPGLTFSNVIRNRGCLPADRCGAFVAQPDYTYAYDPTLCNRGGRHQNPQYQASRYEALNITNEHTVEVRIFRGTLDPQAFFKNLEFVHAVFYFTKDCSAKALEWGPFVEWVHRNPSDYPALVNWFANPTRKRPLSAARSKDRMLRHYSKTTGKAVVEGVETVVQSSKRVEVDAFGPSAIRVNPGFLSISPPLPKMGGAVKKARIVPMSAKDREMYEKQRERLALRAKERERLLDEERSRIEQRQRVMTAAARRTLGANTADTTATMDDALGFRVRPRI